MYTPTFNQFVKPALLVLTLALSGCGGSKFYASDPPAPAVTRVAGGQLQIAGPQGYCIDKSATRDNVRQAFVVLARCDALGGGGQRPASPALLTVAVSGLDPDGESLPPAPMMAAFAESSQGRAMFSADGDPASIEILDTRVSGDVFLMRARDRKAQTEALSPEHWRALFGVKGHLVSARVNAFSKRPISTDAGFETLNALASRIKADNAVSKMETISSDDGATAAVKVSRPGIFARIFR